jgi:hypothetical protein
MLFRIPRRALVAATLSALLAACAEPTAGPTSRAPGAAARSIIGNTVLTSQLRTAPTFPALQWGSVQLKVNVSPGDACVPTTLPGAPDGSTDIAVCGTIKNAGGATYGGGGIYSTPFGIDLPPVLLAPFMNQNAQPPAICPEFDISGVVRVSDDLASQIVGSPASFQVLFPGTAPDNSPTLIGGLLDGSAWGPRGIPGNPIIPGNPVIPGNPLRQSGVCDVTLGPIT